MKNIFCFTILFFTFFQIIGQNQKLLVKNVTVLPLHINQQWNNKDVVIDNGTISEIREHIAKDTAKYTLGIIDGNGKYLAPAFSDAHAHLPEKENLKRFFLMNLLNGVTTIRSMRGETWHLEIDESDAYTPKLILSSPPITRNDEFSEIAANKLIADYKKSGFDFAKILSIKDEKIFDNLTTAARSNEFHFAGHCPNNLGIFKVLNSDVFQSIEHLGGFFDLKGFDEINQAIDLSISQDVYHDATLDWYYTAQVPEEALRNRNGAKYLPKQLTEVWEAKIADHFEKTTDAEREAERKQSKVQFDGRLKYLNYIYQQGGKLLLSPDASGIYGIPGFGVHTEMKHYESAGISNFDILKATSYNLSEMLFSENEWGTIKIGSKSDMVLLNENPLEDIKNAQNLNGIIFHGKFHSKSELESELNKI